VTEVEATRSKIEFVAPGKWKELKTALRQGCSSIGGFKLRILEPSSEEFIVERIEGDWVPKRLRLEYVAHIPAIAWSCCDPHENNGEIGFRVFGDSVFYEVNKRNCALNDIVFFLTSCVTGKI
jgi:hypothetical protein